MEVSKNMLRQVQIGIVKKLFEKLSPTKYSVPLLALAFLSVCF